MIEIFLISIIIVSTTISTGIIANQYFFKFNIYKNRFGVNQDIRYFDPPLNSLAQLNINLYTDADVAVTTFKCKLELIIETKEKLRVYN